MSSSQNNNKDDDPLHLHSPIPTKPLTQPQHSFTKSELSKDSKKMPSLVVKQDPNLKSCLTNTSQASSTTNLEQQQPLEPQQSILVDHFAKTNQHPQIVTNDTISPNMHGLIEQQQTPVVSSISSQITSPETQQTQQPPGISRINSLRYSEQDDKKFIRQSSSTNIPIPKLDQSTEQLNPFHEYLNDDNKLHLLIGITGCISINKNIFLIIEKLFELYTKEKLEIQVILTESAEYILSEKLYKLEQLGVKVWFHDDGEKYFLTSPFQKIYSKAITSGTIPPKSKITPQVLQQYSLAYDLQKWTDVLLLAPLSANTVAKLINGLADNLLTDLLHIWPIPHTQPTITHDQKNSNVISNDSIISPKPIISALALTTAMYGHPITKKQLGLLQETYPNMLILKPVEKIVDNNGNIGMGGMRSWREVVDFVCKKLGPPPEEEENDDDEEDEKEEENDKKPTKKLEISHQDEKLPPIINESRKASIEFHENLKDLVNIREEPEYAKHEERKRGNTISRKELEEHEKLASQNAILNSNIGITPTSIKE
ncbi:unnamed protein product [Candida verbasci]|uniref:Flavoprotein domain-containing protein n=1 Tax=Candida verbasci TaxID=1227364 RepID=A0A9W4TVR5_9ASCO|nr:unnamed protein product [Candida verbasci]